MKNSTASNAVVALAQALSETVADYEARLVAAQKAIDSVGSLLKSDNDERAKAVAVVARLRDILKDRAAGFPRPGDDGTAPCFAALLLNELSDFPWPLPNPVLTPIPKPGG